jgi:hypothetical protein
LGQVGQRTGFQHQHQSAPLAGAQKAAARHKSTEKHLTFIESPSIVRVEGKSRAFGIFGIYRNKV